MIEGHRLVTADVGTRNLRSLCSKMSRDTHRYSMDGIDIRQY